MDAEQREAGDHSGAVGRRRQCEHQLPLLPPQGIGGRHGDRRRRSPSPPRRALAGAGGRGRLSPLLLSACCSPLCTVRLLAQMTSSSMVVAGEDPAPPSRQIEPLPSLAPPFSFPSRAPTSLSAATNGRSWPLFFPQQPRHRISPCREASKPNPLSSL